MQEFEIDEPLYKVFDKFELEDLSYMHEWERHLEQSELYESTLNKRAFYQLEDLEETVLKKIRNEQLHKAVNELPEPYKRRVLLYYFFDMTLEQIAQNEKRSKAAIKYSIDKALEYLKKIEKI
ncbi:MAG: sigma-70 family RNA polymerase sigma factor [Dorea sp.]|nr:sigma-70 family RNA polymerase sigma factor [Dorea sp.]